MGYNTSYTPTYYTSLHDSITTICKSILPFSFKKRRLPAIEAAEQRLSKQQSDNLKWQQDSFHQILKLMGLCKEGILADSEVSTFRTHLLDTLVASPADHEQEVILRDKLVFLQELLYANCISEEEYHSSKRPLLQRLAVQGAEIGVRDVIVSAPKATPKEEWSVIDLKDEHCLLNKNSNSKTKLKQKSPMKQNKGAKSVIGFASSHKNGKDKKELSLSKENPFWDVHLREKEGETRSILMTESLPLESSKKQNEAEKGKKKMFRTMFQREGNESGDCGKNSVDKASKSEKKQWGFDGFKKWKRSDSEDETAPLPLSEKSDSEAFLGIRELISSPIGEGPDIKQIKRKLHSNGSPSDFFIDKVLGEKIKKELSRIQTELNATNPTLKFSDDQIEAISTRLPVDKADLKNFFPKSWCDRYGEVVLDVVRKEFKDHVGEMESLRNAGREKQNNSKRWTTFDDDENCHPNLFAPKENSFPMKQTKYNPLKEDPMYKSFKNNPFSPDYEETNYEGNKQRRESTFLRDHNPFWETRLA